MHKTYPRSAEYARRAKTKFLSVTVVGSDGFGYVLDNGMHRTVPQIGTVISAAHLEDAGRPAGGGLATGAGHVTPGS
jgi:UDP-3-O-[3-hydroxymyristoyl] glucosamine N-acyltransferase